MRKFRDPNVEYKTTCRVFDRGNRNVIVRVTPAGVYVRASKSKDWRFLGWDTIYTRATGAAAGFDPGPSSFKTIVRGGVS